MNAQGDLVRRHHTLATLRFSDVTEFGMKGFNHQNQIFGLASDAQRPSEGRPAAFRVKLEPAFGVNASSTCFNIEVVDAVAWSAEGELPVREGA